MLKSIFRIAIPVAVLLLTRLAVAPDARAEESDNREYGIKAAFIYNFAKFVKWPETAGLPQDKLTLCVAGDDPFGAILDRLVEKSSSTGKQLVVKREPLPGEMALCQILFVSRSEKNRLREILDRTQYLPILVVGDSPDFARMGAGINFFIAENKVRFQINKTAAERAGLRISSELLNLGTIVEGGTGR